MKLRSWPLVAIFLSCWAGCTSKPATTENRLPTFPVTGEVTVDGEPQAGVMIRFHPDLDSSKQKPSPTTITGEGGRFAVSTYQNNDGLPAGNYHLTFTWEELSFSTHPKDQLKNAYSNPQKSKITATVVDNEPLDLGVIELSTKGKAK